MKEITLVKRTINKTVKKTKNKTYFFYLIFSIILIFVIVAMVINPQKYVSVALDALLVWATLVLPSIFPFLLYSKFLTKLGIVEILGKIFAPINKFLYKTEGLSSYIFFMSIISGYPVGAKLTADLYEDGRISRGTAQRTISYCANCGPMFMLATVGVGMLISKQAGYIILISHILGSIFNGILYRNFRANDNFRLKQKLTQDSDDNFLYNTALSSCNSMLIVGTYIVVFFILIEFLNVALGFWLNSQNAFTSIFNGFFEITYGCKNVAVLNLSLNLKTLLSTLIISFGGLSTIFQSMAFLKKIEMKTSVFILQKLTHCFFSSAICCLILLII